MTDHQLHGLHRLDERARAAVTDVHGRAAERPRPAFDPDAPLRLPTPAPATGRVSRRPVYAIAAALLLVVGGLAWASFGRDGGDAPARATTVGAVRPYLAVDLPDGLLPNGFATFDGSARGPLDSGPLSIYGPDPSHPGLGVIAMARFSGSDAEGREQVDIDWTTAYLADGLVGRHALIVREGAGAVYLISPSLDRAELVRIARGMSVTDLRVTIGADTLPSGWTLLGTDRIGFAAFSPIYSNNGGPRAEGFVSAYGSTDSQSIISVISSPGSEANAMAIGLTADSVDRVTVRGHQAVVTEQQADAETGAPRSVTVAWVEGPGHVIQVEGIGLDRPAVIRTAEGLRPATDDEWADLVKKSKLGVFADDLSSGDGASKVEEIGRGSFPAGGDWRLQLVTDEDRGSGPMRSTKLNVADEGSGASSSSGSSTSSSNAAEPDVFVSTEIVDKGGRHFASGLVRYDVARMQLRRADGSVISEAQIVEGAGVRAWVSELTNDPTILVAVDASGTELGRTTVSSGTGSDEGPLIGEDPSPTTEVTTPGPGN